MASGSQKFIGHKFIGQKFIGRTGLRGLGWAALLATAALLCGCGNNSYNPTPAIAALFPSGITAGSQAFTISVGGTNFQSNTTAQWNGVNRPTVYNQSTGQLVVTILDGDVSNPGTGQLTVSNPAPGGGQNPNAVSFVINPPGANGPVITSLSPASVVAGTKTDVMLQVTGQNLVSADTITFNGTQFPTTFAGSTLTATISNQDFSATGLASIAVQTNIPGVASPSVKLPIGPSSNPVPHLTSILPTSTAPNTVPPGGYLLVNGSGFAPGSVVNFNSSPRPTGYSSSTQLAVGVSSADVTGGTIAVTVVNPNPGGGTSSSVNFTVSGN